VTLSPLRGDEKLYAVGEETKLATIYINQYISLNICYTAEMNAKNTSGVRLASAGYLYRLVAMMKNTAAIESS
jgi:hypothetical protein